MRVKVKKMCFLVWGLGKLDGAVKFGNAWAIPEDAEKPQDGRIISGSYKNWR